MRICPSCGNHTNGKTCSKCGTKTMEQKSFILTSGKKLVGKVFGERYKIEKIIGKGAMGIVFKAIQLDMDKPVALKIMKSEIIADDVQIQRFYREAKAASKLKHPNSIKIFEFGQFEEGYPFIAMEYLDGQSLHSVIKKEAPLSTGRVLKIVIQIAKSLAEAHKENILHRDLKPQNIFLKSVYGEEDFVKVLDFGIAKFLVSNVNEQLTQTGYALGTPHYMSPEQAKGLNLDNRSDLYSLGIIFYEMLIGKCPFQGSTAIEIIMKHINKPVPRLRLNKSKFPITLKALDIAYKLMSKHKEERIQNAETLIKLLKPFEIQINAAMLKGNNEHLTKEIVHKNLVEISKEQVSEEIIENNKTKSSAVTSQPKAEDAEKTAFLNASDIPGVVLPDAPEPEKSSSVKPKAEDAEKTAFLNASDIPGVVFPDAPESEKPSSVKPKAEDAEKTAFLNASDIASVMPDNEQIPTGNTIPEAQPEAQEDSEKTIGLDEAPADLLAQINQLKAQADSQETNNQDNAPDGEKTMMFDQLEEATISEPAPSDYAEQFEKNIDAEKTMMFDSDVSSMPSPVATQSAPVSEQDEKTVMFSASDIPNQSLQEEKTVMFDSVSASKAESFAQAQKMQDEATMIFQQDNKQSPAKSVDRAQKTMIADESMTNSAPNVKIVHKKDMNQGAGSNILIWALIMLGALAVVAGVIIFLVAD